MQGGDNIDRRTIVRLRGAGRHLQRQHRKPVDEFVETLLLLLPGEELGFAHAVKFGFGHRFSPGPISAVCHANDAYHADDRQRTGPGKSGDTKWQTKCAHLPQVDPGRGVRREHVGHKCAWRGRSGSVEFAAANLPVLWCKAVYDCRLRTP